MKTIATDRLYLGVGNTITAKTEGGDTITAIVSRRVVTIEGVNHCEVAVRWGAERTYLFVPYTAITKINDEEVRIR